ncbi:MAG: tRNA pseudouridine(55) synthase TruB [Defluviitaleaceae bacterium]|nr:tRNA pseudouridine(55) synthase TruB [Defluviitaleaceae bacterium]
MEKTEKMEGIINVNKPKGPSSHRIVNIVRGATGIKKVGHTGTLDPNATGVLPVCVGKATKFAELIQGGPKVYRAVLILGKKTDTQDITGNIIEEQSVNATAQEITTAINSFVGKIEQLPPMYSAIKMGGVPLYKLARQNIEVERKPRQITIFSIVINKFITDTQLEIDVHCTSGTYIRTLCNDIGEKLGTVATMGDLVRLRSSCFDINDAYTVEQIQNSFEPHYLTPIEFILESYEKIVLPQRQNKFLQNGNTINVKGLDLEQNQIIKIYDHKQNFFGLYKFKNDTLRPMIYIG